MPNDAEPVAEAPPQRVKRHRLSTRLWHWVNAFTVFIMLMSGLMILNAHPRLYWGQYGANFDHAWLEVGSDEDSGYLRVGSVIVDTTGFLGYRERDGYVDRIAFPGWMTIPSTYSLSDGRRWHLFFAWVLVFGIVAYWITGLINRHFWRDLKPSGEELRPRHIWTDVKQHARLRFPRGAAALRYNTLQKLAYILVIFVLLPLAILTGLTMSPDMNAAWPWLLDIFGGRQSARSIHFITATLFSLFIIVHLVMVVLAGPLNEIRSMITGWFQVPPEREEDRA